MRLPRATFWLLLLPALCACTAQLLPKREMQPGPMALALRLPDQQFQVLPSHQPPAPENEPDDRWTLLAAGDIMLSRYVATLQDRSDDPAFPFGRVTQLIRGADIAFANLENPIAEGTPVPAEGLVFHMHPSLTPLLSSAGFDVLSLANNHMTDAGLPAVAATRQHLAAEGLAFAGAGATETEARTPALLRVRGRTVAVLAYGDPRFWKQVRFATTDSPGVAEASAGAIAEDVAAARELADVVIVSLHAGIEYRAEPDSTQSALADAAAAAGADLVLGHHPHVLQPLRWIGRTPVAYSLGNFVFDQVGTDVNRSAALLFTFRGSTVESVEVVPILIDGAEPSVATGATLAEVLRSLQLPAVRVVAPSA